MLSLRGSFYAAVCSVPRRQTLFCASRRDRCDVSCCPLQHDESPKCPAIGNISPIKAHHCSVSARDTRKNIPTSSKSFLYKYHIPYMFEKVRPVHLRSSRDCSRRDLGKNVPPVIGAFDREEKPQFSRRPLSGERRDCDLSSLSLRLLCVMSNTGDNLETTTKGSGRATIETMGHAHHIAPLPVTLRCVCLFARLCDDAIPEQELLQHSSGWSAAILLLRQQRVRDRGRTAAVSDRMSHDMTLLHKFYPPLTYFYPSPLK